ncbi:MAG TPA: hypothetical protein ENN07_04365 [candidate division Zixibacteria bacterium]|nr:hypothetical protein [candidate division Zixibacteria bacterium]
MLKRSIVIPFVLCLAAWAFEVDVREAGPLGVRAVRDAAKGVKSAEISDAVRELYIDEGYLMAEVFVRPDSARKRIAIEVDAGARAFVESFDVVGWEGDLPRMQTSTNKHFRRKDLALDMTSIVVELENSGFPFAVAKIETLNIGAPDNGKIPVRIAIGVERGDSVAIGAVLVPNNTKTQVHVIQKTMLIRPPEIFSQRLITAGVRRLNNLGYVRVVGEPEPVLDESGVWALWVNFTEGRTVLIDGVFGYAPREGQSGLSGQIDATFDNIWGTGRQIKLNWKQSGDDFLRFSTGYKEPFLFGGFGAMKLSADYHDRGNSYTERNFGAEYRYPLSFVFSVSLGGAIKSILPDSAGVARIPISRQTRIDFGAHVEKLYPRVNPTSGWDASFTISPVCVKRSGQALELLALDEFDAIARLEASISTALSFGRNFVLYERIVGRSVQLARELPLSDLYFLGGWGSLRGYREEQFSAEHIGWSNTEFRALLGGDAHGFAFFDAGAHKRYGEDAQLNVGYGIGLRLSTAIGRWTVAYGVAGGESLTDGMIHVGLSGRGDR